MPQKIKLLRRVVERNGYRILLKKERKTLAGSGLASCRDNCRPRWADLQRKRLNSIAH
jgi:hypothetical protein